MVKGNLILSCALALATASVLFAADEPMAPTTQPTHTRKLFEPYGMMKSLSPEQSAQIEKIHVDALEEKKKIDAKEDDDIKALLTPAQITEMATVEEKIKTDRKDRAGMRKKKDMPTTEPTK